MIPALVALLSVGMTGNVRGWRDRSFDKSLWEVHSSSPIKRSKGQKHLMALMNSHMANSGPFNLETANCP